MDETAAASFEQVQGIVQIDKAVVEMDKMFKQNAANAQESESASDEMTAQEERMKNNTNEKDFKVKGRDVSASQPKEKPAISHGHEISPAEVKYHWEMMIYRNFSYFLKYNYQ